MWFRRLSPFALLVSFLFYSLLYAKDQAPESYLPLPGFSKEWVVEGKVEIFSKDNLFEHINGEAEIFFPYGFDRLASAFYKKGNHSPEGLVADIYRMGSLLEAFGIYANFRGSEAEPVSIGSEGFITPSKLMFYQDRYFIRLSASGTLELDQAVLSACAGAIAGSLPGPKTRPQELERIKIPQLIPLTEKVVPQSLLGYPFLRKGIMARAAHEGKAVRVFSILEDSEEEAEGALDQYIAYLKSSGVSPKKMKKDRGVLLMAMDPLYKGAILIQKGRYIVGVVDLSEPSRGTPLVEQLLARISRP